MGKSLGRGSGWRAVESAMDRASAARGRLRRVARGAARVDRLERRVASLEREVTEARRMNRRLAELTDVVQELLLPVAQRDGELMDERLSRYASEI